MVFKIASQKIDVLSNKEILSHAQVFEIHFVGGFKGKPFKLKGVERATFLAYFHFEAIF